MNNAQRISIIIITLICSSLHAQLAIGPKLYTRTSTDRIGTTYGYGINALFLAYDTTKVEGVMSGGFDISIPQYFDGSATFDAIDSNTVPFNITVPITQRVTDYVLRIEFGYCINPKAKSNAVVVSLGLRGIYRHIKINYHEDYDEGTYDRYSIHRNPNIPAALNAGLILGFGYVCKFNHFAMYPNLAYGFGSGDRRNKHPWNDYPNYFEFSLTFMLVTNIGKE